ncbi:MAG: AraC family transcriptional regulator [Verrucomicrobiota bacterium]
MSKRTTFRSNRELFHADTCQPLKIAAKQGDLCLAALGRGSYPGERLPRHDLKEVCMVGYWDAPRDQNWGLDWHCNEGIEIGYVSKGKLPFSVGDASFLVEPGHLTITRPWQRHCVGNPNVPACHYSWLILDVGMRRPNQTWHWPGWLLSSKAGLKRLTEMLSQNEQAVWRADRKLGDCFDQLDRAVARKDRDTGNAKIKILINELIILLADLLESRNPLLDQSLSSSERTVRLFLENLSHRIDEPWTLDSMAAACGLGRTHFSTYCKKISNVAPGEYLTRARIDAAARLLMLHPEASVTDIAFRCGFQSSQYFSNVFRKQHGHSPSYHRQEAI